MRISLQLKIFLYMLIIIVITIVSISFFTHNSIIRQFDSYCRMENTACPAVVEPVKGKGFRYRNNWNTNQTVFVESVQSKIIWVGLGVSALAFLISYLLSKKIATPIQNLTRITSDIAQGNQPVEITRHSQDEIGDLEDSLKIMYEQIQKIESIRKDLITNLSHEMSTPLTSIHGYLEAMEEGMLKTKQDKDTALSVMKEQTNRLIRMVRDLRDLSKFESNSITMNKKWIELKPWIDKLQFEFKPIAEQKKSVIRFSVLPEKLKIYTDPILLHTIIMNLLDNALKYSDPLSEITLNIREEKAGAIQIEVLNPGEPLFEEEIQHVFERFYRGKKARQQSILGNGIGLSIVKDIISKLSGEIHYFYTSDNKHLFQVRIPTSPVG